MSDQNLSTQDMIWQVLQRKDSTDTDVKHKVIEIIPNLAGAFSSTFSQMPNLYTQSQSFLSYTVKFLLETIKGIILAQVLCYPSPLSCNMTLSSIMTDTNNPTPNPNPIAILPYPTLLYLTSPKAHVEKPKKIVPTLISPLESCSCLLPLFVQSLKQFWTKFSVC